MTCDGLGFEPECHIQAPLLSLPAIFGTTIETIPAAVPYLFPDPGLVEHWRSVLARIRDGHPLLVGIAWQGRPENAADHWRSYPLERMAPLASVPGVRLVSLQVGRVPIRSPTWAVGSRSSSCPVAAAGTSPRRPPSPRSSTW
jgi:hypothetical protein